MPLIRLVDRLRGRVDNETAIQLVPLNGGMGQVAPAPEIKRPVQAIRPPRNFLSRKRTSECCGVLFVIFCLFIVGLIVCLAIQFWPPAVSPGMYFLPAL